MSQTDESLSAAAPTPAAPAEASSSALPAPPREITPRVRRRAWGDIHVRFWWLSALAVALVIGYFTAHRVREALRDRDLIQNGVPVKTTIKTAGDKYMPGQSEMRNSFKPVTLLGQMPDGQEREFRGEVPPGPGYLVIGQPLEIRVARDDPSEWTAQLEPLPWTRELAMSLLFLPAIVLLLLIAWLMRRRVLRVWSQGEPADAVIKEVKHSAYAPRSRVLRFSLLGGDDRRIFTALCPPGVPVPAVGQQIQLLMLPSQPNRSIWTRPYVG